MMEECTLPSPAPELCGHPASPCKGEVRESPLPQKIHLFCSVKHIADKHSTAGWHHVFPYGYKGRGEKKPHLLFKQENE